MMWRWGVEVAALRCSVLFCCALALSPVPALAWDASLEDSPALPSSMVAVDKGARRLLYLEKHSPLAVRRSFPSIHGQSEGDKQTEGDLRTPEGIYFVTGRIGGPLDFEEYGSQAHGLNYPNPVDRLRGKTGSGIWIHSKGHPIAGQSTRGCIAVDLADIDTLAPSLRPGTPVLVAERVATDESGAPASIVKLLTDKTEAWNKAWASRSSAMFDFYDADAYARAQGESFGDFRAQKAGLFARLPWIQIQHGEINVLQGPGYWVSWFPQYYRAPNLRTEGIRRLYWQPVKNGELKIVGMEWLPQDLGMERAYLDSLTPSVFSFVEKWRLAWEKADLKGYAAAYAPSAVQDARRGREAIMEHKRRTWDGKRPVSVELRGLRIRLEEDGVRVDMTQVYRDSSGYRDKGVKELLLYPEGDSWRIVSETWSES